MRLKQFLKGIIKEFLLFAVILPLFLSTAVADEAGQVSIIEQKEFNTHGGELIGDRQFIQSFTCDNDIAEIDIMFATFGRNNTKDVIFRLKDDLSSKTDLVYRRVNAAEMKNDEWHRFSFMPVHSKIGNKYYIVLESPDSAVGNAFTVRVSDKNPYLNGQFVTRRFTNGGRETRLLTGMPVFNSHAGEICGDTRVVKQFSSAYDIAEIDIMFATFGRNNTKDVIFRLKDDLSSKTDLVYRRVNAAEMKNDEWHRFSFMPVHSKIGNKYYIVIESPASSAGDAVTVRTWHSAGGVRGGMTINGMSKGDDLTFEVFTSQIDENYDSGKDIVFKVHTTRESLLKTPPKIEYYNWEFAFNRKVYRSRATDISMTFGGESVNDVPFYENFLSYDVDKWYDYFCLPDDVIIAYNERIAFIVRADALKWDVSHGLVNDGVKAFLTYFYKEAYGLRQAAEVDLAAKIAGWKAPPASISVTHEMYYNKNYVPMMISIRNTFKDPLHYIYIFQDGSWLSEGAQSQQHVRQYWDDGEYDYPRVWRIDETNRYRKNNWMGMYNDLNGGMFAGTYAPSESKGVRLHATWDSERPHMSHGALVVPYLDEFFGHKDATTYWKDGWYKLENILSHIDTPNTYKKYENPYGKIHGTVIDFGTIPSGEERSQVLVKIMFTGYKDREDMHRRIREIIEQIPTFEIPSYGLEQSDGIH
ncbi:MAG: hypothetical protein M0Z67_07315 [Nitrospiraceae bacterium]|nr:hypothetical protein [Nitrospiraceae bacterium]